MSLIPKFSREMFLFRKSGCQRKEGFKIVSKAGLTIKKKKMFVDLYHSVW